MSKVGTASGNEPTTNATMVYGTGGVETTEGRAELVGAEAKVGEDSYARVTDELDKLLLQASQMIELE